MSALTQSATSIRRSLAAVKGFRPSIYARTYTTLRRPTYSQIQAMQTTKATKAPGDVRSVVGSAFVGSHDSMTAFRWAPGATSPHRSEVPVPLPKPNEVLLKVLAAGLCHSDLGILDPCSNLHTVSSNHYTLGHEGAGEIAAIGSNVAAKHPELKVGTYVAMFGPNACFEESCHLCSTGRDNLCPNSVWLGVGSDGSWADYMVLPATSCVPIPGSVHEIPPAIAAVATDAVLTPYHALKTASKVQPGQTVLCMGIGGLGLNAIAIAKHCLNAGTVIACDMKHSSLNQALEVGADLALTPEALEGYIKEHNIFVDVAVDFVGMQNTFDLARRVVAPGGIVHIVGLMQSQLTITPLEMMSKDLTVKVSLWGCKSELVEVLQAIKDGKVKPVVEERSMEDCEVVLEELKAGKLRSRVALIPSHLQ